MDFGWLRANVRRCLTHRGSAADFLRRLAWTYSHALPRWLRPAEFTFSVSYPPPVGGLNVCVRANGGSDAFIFSEVFDHAYYALPLGFVPATVLDLGANAGFTALYFARAYPGAGLACVEPVPANAALLRRNLARNGIDATVFEAAASSGDGDLQMALDAMDYGHRVTRQADGADGASIRVPCLSVPSLLSRLGWPRIGLLKVDIEGHERELLGRDRDWLHRVDALCIECHEGYGEADLREIAERYGFQAPRGLPGNWLLLRKDLAPAPLAR